MNTFFLLLRICTGLVAAGSILILLAIVLLRSLPGFAKHVAGVIAYTVVLFGSAFTKGTPPKDPAWVVALPQVALAILFAAMMVSVFLPGSQIVLHLLAGFTVLALLWYGWMTLTQMKLEILCLPAILVWLAYYLVCIFWYDRQNLAPATGP